jgi:hypothetical protein
MNEWPKNSTIETSKEVWSKEEIASNKELAIAVWRRMKHPPSEDLLKSVEVNPSEVSVERVIGEAFPDLSEQSKNIMCIQMMACIRELASEEHPEMVQQITPEQFKDFANLYLTERFG